MIPELGHFSLILAFILASLQSVLPLVGAARRDQRLMRLAHPLAQTQFAFVLIAFVCLVQAFAVNDFSVVNVALNSNSQLPLHYRITASWGSHEGSLLLWALMLALWTFAVTRFSRALPTVFVARVLAVMGLLSTGFLLFMLFTSNPFERVLPPVAEGRDLNPLLQDPGMVIHPPMLYMGYVGFSVAFAFAVAALLGGRLDASWARWSRPWTALAWCFLTVGIALGSAWAYYELGWGGWWFWDPVENASFMPWLVGTALIHSLAVTEKRGAFKSWTVLLAILAFSLSLLGTFLVRSGVLTSVHAFATDPARGIFILAFLAIVVGGSLTLYAWRARAVSGGATFAPVSRESFLLANNILLMVAAGAVLLGTLYPLLLDALGLGKISVGPPYFEAVFTPLMALTVFLIAIGPLARWQRSSVPELATRLRWAFAVSVITALSLPFTLGDWKPLVSVGLLLALWIVTSGLMQLGQRWRGVAAIGWHEKFAASSRSYYGMHIAHLGVAVFIVGVTLVKGYESERDVRLKVGETTMVGGYPLTFVAVKEVEGPNYRALRARFELNRSGKQPLVLEPEKRLYAASGQTMTEAAIDSGLTRDLYLALGEPLDDGVWGVRIFVKPFVNWIWFGCFIMAAGGLLALSDRRYRLRSNQQPATSNKQQATSH